MTEEKHRGKVWIPYASGSGHVGGQQCLLSS